MNHPYIVENSRIYLKGENGKLLAEIIFPRLGEAAIEITHTFVDPSLRGQGIAGELVEEVIAKAKKEKLKIKPVCSYAGAYFEKHPELSALLYKD
jgi:predicted GNAT family acetyltransferase